MCAAAQTARCDAPTLRRRCRDTSHANLQLRCQRQDRRHRPRQSDPAPGNRHSDGRSRPGDGRTDRSGDCPARPRRHVASGRARAEGAAVGTHGQLPVRRSRAGVSLSHRAGERRPFSTNDELSDLMGPAASPLRPSGKVFVACGLWLVALGAYFLFLRPAVLPEDLRYIGSSLETMRSAAPGLERWLGHVFDVMGGFMVAAGAMTVLAAWRLRARSERVSLGGVVAGRCGRRRADERNELCARLGLPLAAVAARPAVGGWAGVSCVRGRGLSDDRKPDRQHLTAGRHCRVKTETSRRVVTGREHDERNHHASSIQADRNEDRMLWRVMRIAWRSKPVSSWAGPRRRAKSR